MPYRILHIADVHLDMAFTGADVTLGSRRREQLLEAFERSLQLARERGVDALCIAGDLYEDGRSKPDRAAYLCRVLGALVPMRVFIAPGNHDPYSATSIYSRMDHVPDNVKIFARRRFAPVPLADGLTLWGFAHEHDVDRNPALADFACEGSGMHLLLFHGSDRERIPPGKDAVAPFSGSEVERTGARHAMVGHFHGLSEGARHAYPGSLEPHNFSQDGRHTASVVTVEDGTVTTEFVDVNRVRYATADFDVSPFGDRAALAQALRSHLESAGDWEGTIYSRIRLTGEVQSSLDLDPGALESELGERFPGLKIEDESAAFDLDAVMRQGRTVRTEFVREMRKRIEAAAESEKPQLEKALRYGMLAFADRTIPR